MYSYFSKTIVYNFSCDKNADKHYFKIKKIQTFWMLSWTFWNRAIVLPNGFFIYVDKTRKEMEIWYQNDAKYLSQEQIFRELFNTYSCTWERAKLVERFVSGQLQRILLTICVRLSRVFRFLQVISESSFHKKSLKFIRIDQINTKVEIQACLSIFSTCKIVLNTSLKI